MSIEQNKALIYRLYDLYNQHDLDATSELFSPGLSGAITFEQNKQFDIMIHKAFPDFKSVILDMIAEGDKVAYIVNVTATHTGGPFWGIQPTGKKINIANTWIVKIANNRIVEGRGTFDTLPLLQQLGAVPKW